MARPREWTQAERDAYQAQLRAARAEHPDTPEPDPDDELVDRLDRQARIYRLQDRARPGVHRPPRRPQ